MAHFAKIENGIVTNVIVVSDEHEEDGPDWLNSIGLDGQWIQTSYNGKIRKNYAGIGYKYNNHLDAFIAPKPYDSWILNEETCQWEPPIKNPNNPEYSWDENIKNWIINK
jgi:hypothetical protein